MATTAIRLVSNVLQTQLCESQGNISCHGKNYILNRKSGKSATTCYICPQKQFQQTVSFNLQSALFTFEAFCSQT